MEKNNTAGKRNTPPVPRYGTPAHRATAPVKRRILPADRTMAPAMRNPGPSKQNHDVSSVLRSVILQKMCAFIYPRSILLRCHPVLSADMFEGMRLIHRAFKKWRGLAYHLPSISGPSQDSLVPKLRLGTRGSNTTFTVIQHECWEAAPSALIPSFQSACGLTSGCRMSTKEEIFAE